MSTTKIEETDHAKDQAKAQLESIVEMVNALDEEKARRTAAEEYAKNIDRDRCVELLLEASIDSSDDETVETLREAVIENIADETITPDDFEFEFNDEDARQAIQEDPLSVQVRSDWYSPGSEDEKEAAEFEILLCTGGPAVRIVGDLDGGQPSRPRIQYQDWGTPWTEYFHDEHDALQAYCEQFYFGD